AVPKYLNGPQTDLFDKGSTLYGMPDAATAIRREQRAVVVEGYVDVVIAHQAGFQNVVATLGTSITDRHLRQLARLASQITLALDGDAAGQHAAMRGAEVAREALSDAAVPVPTWRGLIRYESGSRETERTLTISSSRVPTVGVRSSRQRSQSSSTRSTAWPGKTTLRQHRARRQRRKPWYRSCWTSPIRSSVLITSS
ncbi:MAG: toprim domain-containing protein, partial [Chloroflexi bacterium]